MNETQLNAVIGSFQSQINDYAAKLAIADGNIAMLQKQLEEAKKEEVETSAEVAA